MNISPVNQLTPTTLLYVNMIEYGDLSNHPSDHAKRAYWCTFFLPSCNLTSPAAVGISIP